ncbi:MAG: serine hydrolase domain-containing protein, partial [Vicinamibacterales bacterium]
MSSQDQNPTRGALVGVLLCLVLVVQAGSVSAELDRARLARIDTLVEAAIQDGQLPGAVVVVGHAGQIVYERAFGARSVNGPPEVMAPDTIFDLASLTKVVATTTSVMILVEEGRLRLRDRVVTHLPEFASHGKDRITVEHLLTHTSGLRPDLPLDEVFEGAETAIARAADEVPEAAPGERFVYSDINFFVLGEIVRRVTGQTLDRFARDRIFEPLGMTDTGFNPPSSLIPRIAPTEPCAPLAWPCGGDGAVMLRGRVHDPTARRMGGVAGHAGLFSTAADLARYCRMLLGDGTLDDVRILAPLTVARMTRVSTPPHVADRRG